MKRKYFIVLGAFAIAIGAAVNVGISSNGSYLSDIAFANIEALARNEGGDCTGLAMLDCKIWNVTYHNADHITCTPGGSYVCMFPLK